MIFSTIFSKFLVRITNPCNMQNNTTKIGEKWVKLLAALANNSVEICFNSLSYLSLRFEIFVWVTNLCVSKLSFFSSVNFVHFIKKYINFLNIMEPNNKNIIPKSLPTDSYWRIFLKALRLYIKKLDGNIAVNIITYVKRLCCTPSLCRKYLFLKLELPHSMHNLTVSIMKAVGEIGLSSIKKTFNSF